MQTPRDSMSGAAESTMPAEIAGLDVEVQAMFERVCTRLGLAPERPHTIGRYQIRGWIANGGMGEVHHAYDIELDREVAIKLVLPRPMSNLDLLRERLRREAKLLAKLDHANVVTVYDAGVENGRVFLVMQLITGVTLRERQARKGCTLRERLRLYSEAGRGLSFAHARGIVHRDFKPDNVFVGEDDHARVGDFGLAHMLDESEIPGEPKPGEPRKLSMRVTRTGELLGTLGYMAPEQLDRQRADARSDQYAFCVSLWEGVTGVRPFVGVNAKALLEAMAGEPRGGEWLPRRLRRALRVGLALRPEDRHASMVELLAALDRELGRPKRLVLAGLGSVLGAAAIAGLLFGWFGLRAANPECELADEIAALPAGPHWSALSEHTSPGTSAHFERYIRELENGAREACLTNNLSLEQQVKTQFRTLALTIEAIPNYTHEQIGQFIDEFEDALASRPSQPLTPEMATFVEQTLAPLEVNLSPDHVRRAATKGLDELARTNVDRAEILLHRGRANSWLGDYADAVADFKQARRYATAGLDEDRELRANIGAAKTTIMRRSEHLEAGAELLELVEDQLWAFREPLLSVRRADFVELSATLARHQGRLDQALSLQRRVVLRHAVFSSAYELVPALVNLGNINTDRGEISAAERSYRLALTLDRDDAEACFGLGLLLVNEDQRPDEARELLGRVLATEGHDLHVAAAYVLLELEIYAEESTALVQRRDQLIALLRSDRPRAAMVEREGWVFATLGFAAQGEFGPQFEDALRQIPAPDGEREQFAFAQLELAIAEFAASKAQPAVATRFAASALTRLQQLPHSPARAQSEKTALELRGSPDSPDSSTNTNARTGTTE
ncbi:Serine/threonine protein kinase [Enhygromyxa salina]|uniref:Serine/threonine protein kinase n=1 Tax=Enhygromyxa salina TaxID=215803 RepID=A0A0C1Z4F5_9BACT|nr:serine/threonine-protein kinase [Enhygromyxa salina]KIG12554.1 Serine/threonine protein kinase [Enhygromyxa salina]